ncbi:T9SS type A sorting domain-containing protein [Chitinophaga sp. MD30]|uniref:T9SS type A sorting domain-containing protein n=1 Tax=Chitinophaga sp. MD30 TaxID=2033437 RepID=UPI000BAFF742|nr:T9SS type A sorting domain-containing protein [Chitinophaga sp. MD30]ASZ14464.1 hypothetical protein CK934_27725 [Chitinophaga sp. MD30]
MKQVYKIVVAACWWILQTLVAQAQQGVYVPAGGKVFLTGDVPVSIYGNVYNDGTIGSTPQSVLHFFGKYWTNADGSSLHDESPDGLSGKGGLFRFSANNPLYNNIGQQIVYGGYNIAAGNGPSFPNLELNNPAGLQLADLSDLKIRNHLQLGNGHIFLNGWNLMVGHNNPGSIAGYSDRSFVVTGTEMAGGFLYRARLGSTADTIVYPIGTGAGNYSPAAIIYSGATDDFKARVFDKVYSGGSNGQLIPDSFVNKTWNIGRQKPANNEVNVLLQHMNADEPLLYQQYRGESYISRYTSGGWERLQTLEGQQQPGRLSTLPLQKPATLHARLFAGGINTSDLFAKTALIKTQPPVAFLSFEAYRISAERVQLDWSTKWEINNQHFELERRLENETEFTRIATLPTKAPGGNSSQRLNYTYQDPNDFDGWSYYRVKAVNNRGDYVYSEIRAVAPFIQIVVFPNPNFGQFKVRIRGIRSVLMMQLYDTWGQVIRQKEIQRDGEVQILDMPKGMYILVLYHKGTQQVAFRQKVIVRDR